MNKQRFSLKVTFFEAALVIFILIAAFIMKWVVDSNTQRSPGDFIVVRQNGKVIMQLDKEQLNKNGIYDFKFDKGTGQLEVKDRKVRILPMDKKVCPRSICSNTGWISGRPQTIICMPNLITVSFAGSDSSASDGATY
jgi:hypothetical protein